MLHQFEKDKDKKIQETPIVPEKEFNFEKETKQELERRIIANGKPRVTGSHGY